MVAPTDEQTVRQLVERNGHYLLEDWHYKYLRLYCNVGDGKEPLEQLARSLLTEHRLVYSPILQCYRLEVRRDRNS